jgi:hypothetical protein
MPYAAPRTLHSRDFRPSGVSAGDRVHVVGAGNSAADVAMSALRAGAEVWLEWPRVPWLVPRFVGTVPTDAVSLDLDRVLVSVRGLTSQRRLAALSAGSAARIAAVEHGAMPRGLPYQGPTITGDCIASLLHERERVFLCPVHGRRPMFDLTVLCTGYLRPNGPTGLGRDGIERDATGTVSTSHPGLYFVGDVNTESGGFDLYSRMAGVVAAFISARQADVERHATYLHALAGWSPDLCWGLRRPSSTSTLMYAQALGQALDELRAMLPLTA